MGKFASIFGKRASSGGGAESASGAATETVTETVTETEGQTVTQTETQYATLGNVPQAAQAVPAAGHQFGTYDGQLHPVSAATIARLTGKQKQGES